MSATNYSACLKFTLQWEGGWSNHKADPGGATMRGVTQRVYNAYRTAHNKPIHSVYYITDAEVGDIYRRQYWDVVRGDQLPIGIDLAVFDHAVNSGPVAAIKMLQRSVGVTADGNFGLVTLNAVQRAKPRELVLTLTKSRQGFLERLKTFKVFGRGWTRRVTAVRTTALVMIGA